MAPCTFLCSLLLLGAAAHDDGSSSRRLTFRYTNEPIWGGCRSKLGSLGCVPSGGFQCSDRLSDGPDDADIQIVIGGLPSSTAEAPVHLQFWSARKSPTEYDPLVTLVNCSVYEDLLDGYPKYDDSDFNGGNVLVSEMGTATIRVRAPATYMVKWFEWLWEIPVPHIHLRLCHGSDLVQKPWHGVFFSDGITWLASVGRPHLTLDHVGRYENRSASMPPDPSAPAPVKIIVGRAPVTEQTTTVKAETATFTTTEAPSPSPSPVPTPTEPEPAPTPTPVPIPDPDDKGVLINAARDALDLDALEFSPVYQCLLEDAFFDHFSSDCLTECPAESDTKHGQCVKAETDDEVAELAVTWKLEINCGGPCWHDKKLVSMHNLRLNVADLLDIPFQEVQVEMGFLDSSSRRLTGAAKTAYLTVKVTSNRLVPLAGGSLLEQFVRSVAFISQLLGLDVLSADVVSKPDGQFLEEPVKMDKDTDPYEPAYTALETRPPSGPPDSVLSFLPPAAIIGIAVGVVVIILSVIVGTLLWRRRRAQQARNAQANAKVADPEEPDPKKPNAVAAPEEPANQAEPDAL